MPIELKTIDNHVHIAGPGDRSSNDLYWHDRFEKGIGFRGLKFLKGWWPFTKVTNQLMINALLKQTRTMKRIDYAVVLAFDHVYDVDGNCMGPDNGDKTTLFVGNDFVDTLCTQNRNLLPGISVHPFRNDAVEELDRYHKNAVLCKWMASAQLIDFENPKGKVKLDIFFDKLVHLKLPLLYHTGVETSIPCAEGEERYNKFNSPSWLRGALDKGVTVIVAHCGCSYFAHQDDVREEVFALFREMREESKNWKLYADISALFSPDRKWEKLVEIFDKIPKERLIYGSDFPNPAKDKKEFVLFTYLKYKSINLIDNYFKISNRELPKYYGQNHGVFSNFHQLLIDLDRGDIIENKEEQKRRWYG